MVQNKLITVFFVAAAATILPVLAAPTPLTTLDLAAREPQIYERSFDGPLDLEERDLNLYDEVELDAREPVVGNILNYLAEKKAEHDEYKTKKHKLSDMRRVHEQQELALIHPTAQNPGGQSMGGQSMGDPSMGDPSMGV